VVEFDLEDFTRRPYALTTPGISKVLLTLKEGGLWSP
jgi:hypothetical protein